MDSHKDKEKSSQRRTSQDGFELYRTRAEKRIYSFQMKEEAKGSEDEFEIK